MSFLILNNLSRPQTSCPAQRSVSGAAALGGVSKPLKWRVSVSSFFASQHGTERGRWVSLWINSQRKHYNPETTAFRPLFIFTK